MADTASPSSGAASDLRRLHRDRRRDTLGAVRDHAESAINRSLNSIVTNHPAALTFPPRQLLVGCYVADDGEVSVHPVIEDLRTLGHNVALPHLVGERMDFRTWHTGDALEAGRFGIPTPVNGQTVGAHELDLVLTPLVAFNRTCDRVGRGGGFYDRTFGPLQNFDDRPILLGVAFEHQHNQAIPVLAHDVPLDAVVTELGVRWRSTTAGAPSLTPTSASARKMACE